jgi:cytochrome c
MLLTSKGCRGVLAALGWCFGLMLGSSALAQSSSGAAAGSPAPLTLEEGLALAKARACLGCHQVDNKRVGPSFRAIAQRHADKNDAVPYLVQVIQKGGRGQWGAVPMPGQSVNHQDAEKLAQWILTLRKQ